MARRFEALGENAKQLADLYRSFAGSYRSQKPWQFRAEDYTWPDVEAPRRSRSQLQTLRKLREPLAQYHPKPHVGMLLVRQHACEFRPDFSSAGLALAPGRQCTSRFCAGWVNTTAAS
jgi:hypothetical protein